MWNSSAVFDTLELREAEKWDKNEIYPDQTSCIILSSKVNNFLGVIPAHILG